MNEISNRPDPTPEILSRLDGDYPHLSETVADYEVAIAALPETVNGKDDHDRFVDLIAKMRGSYKNVEAARVAEKEPFLKSERAVDGYFDPFKKKLEGMGSTLSRKVKTWLDAKAEAERQERLAEARRQAEEAARLREAEEEARRRAEAAVREKTREDRARIADALAAEAERATHDAAVAQRAADEKPAEMARTRSDGGTLSTLKSHWTHEVLDYDAIPLDQLRAYLKREDIDKAIRAAVKFGVREIAGTRIYQDTGLQVR